MKPADRSVIEAVAVFGALLIAILVLAFMLPSPAHGEPVYSTKTGTIRVHNQTPCPPEIAVHAPQGKRGYYRAADVYAAGEHFKACAATVTVKGRQGYFVHMIYDNGTSDILPLKNFHEEGSAETI